MREVIKKIEKKDQVLSIEKILTGYIVIWQKPDKTIESNLVQTLPEAGEIFDAWFSIGDKS